MYTNVNAYTHMLFVFTYIYIYVCSYVLMYVTGSSVQLADGTDAMVRYLRKGIGALECPVCSQVCVLQCVALCCIVLQCVAVCCSVLQCVAVCCS